MGALKDLYNQLDIYDNVSGILEVRAARVSFENMLERRLAQQMPAELGGAIGTLIDGYQMQGWIWGFQYAVALLNAKD